MTDLRDRAEETGDRGGSSIRTEPSRSTSAEAALEPPVPVDQERVKADFILLDVRRILYTQCGAALVVGVGLYGADRGGTLLWLALAAVTTAAQLVTCARLTATPPEAHRVVQIVRVVVFVGGVLWGALPLMVHPASIGSQVIFIWAGIASISTAACAAAADRLAFAATFFPNWVLNAIGMATLSGPAARPMTLLWLASGPLCVSTYGAARRLLTGLFESDRRYRDLVGDLDRQRLRLETTSARLAELTEQQATRLEERHLLITAIAHDLASPLTASSLSVDLVLGADRPAHQTDRLLETTSKSLSYAMWLLSDLTSVQLGSKDKIFDQPRPIDFEANVARIVEGLGIAPERVTLVKGVAPTTIVADPIPIARIIENLLSNAVKHTPQGTPIRIGMDACGRDCRIWVEDDGPGLDVDAVQSASHPAVRDGAEHRRPVRGVGLLLVKAFAEMLGGSLHTGRSDTGGSRFTVVLPERVLDEPQGRS